MKKVLILFSFIFFIQCIVIAQKITEQQALLKAKEFMNGKKLTSSKPSLTRALTKDKSEYESEFYVFNVENNGGFVIVSSDERTEEILGYSNEGNIDFRDLPENTYEWLESYAMLIHSLNNTDKISKVERAEKAFVKPLLNTKWNQYEPYNWMCPQTNGSYCLTGCVATAMAQIMNYYQWPVYETTSIPAYDNQPSLPETIFKWSKMKNEYNHDEYLKEEGEAVAELMKYCGQSVKTRYSLTVSTTMSFSGFGSTAEGEALKKYFDYSPNYFFVTRRDYPTFLWEEYIYREIAAGHPVFYDGGSITNKGRHAFILDGYDGNGMFHVNWGWGGYCDGYFSLSILDSAFPNENIGNPNNGWCADQMATLGIVPRKENEGSERKFTADHLRSLFFEGESMGCQSKRENNQMDFHVYIHSRFCNMEYSNVHGDFCIALLQGGFRNSNIVTILDSEHIELNTRELFDKKNFYDFGIGLKDGDYILTTLYRADGDTEWHMPTTDYYIVSITDNDLKIGKYDHIKSPSSLNLDYIYVEGNYEVGDTLRFVMDFTNVGYKTGEYINIRENDAEIGYIYIISDFGDKVQGVINYVPQSSGIKHIEIVSAQTGDGDGVYRKTFYEETVFIKSTSISSAKKSLEKAIDYIDIKKKEIANGKEYEVKSRNDLEIAFNEIYDSYNLVNSYEEKEKQGLSLSEDELEILKRINQCAKEFEASITNNEYKVNVSCNEGGCVELGMSVMRNAASKELYWLTQEAFRNFKHLSGKWYNSSNYGGIKPRMYFTPDKGYIIKTIVHNGNEVNEVNHAEGNVVVIFLLESDGVKNIITKGKSFDIYSIQGQKIKLNSSSINCLPKGIYIINGNKVLK